MAHYYNESTRVKIPALITLSRLGYKYISLKNVHYDPESNIFTSIFSESIKKINKEKNLSDDEIKKFQQDINLELDNDDLGRKFYERLINATDIKLYQFPNDNAIIFDIMCEVKTGEQRWQFTAKIYASRL